MKYWNKGNYTMPHGTSKIKVFPGEGSVNWDSAACNLIVVNETTGFLDNDLMMMYSVERKQKWISNFSCCYQFESE